MKGRVIKKAKRRGIAKAVSIKKVHKSLKKKSLKSL
jgi:hypothetical protein